MIRDHRMSGYYDSQQVGLNGTAEQKVRGGRSGESEDVVNWGRLYKGSILNYIQACS